MSARLITMLVALSAGTAILLKFKGPTAFAASPKVRLGGGWLAISSREDCENASGERDLSREGRLLLLPSGKPSKRGC